MLWVLHRRHVMLRRKPSPAAAARIMTHSRPLILLALAALLPLILLSAVLGAAWLRQQQAAMERGALDSVRHASEMLERELSAQIEMLHVLALSPLFDGALDPAAVFAAIERVRREEPLWRLVSLSDPDGNRLVDAPQPVAGGRGLVVEADSHARVVASATSAIGPILRGPLGNAAFAIRVPVTRDGKLLYVLSAVVMPDAVSRLLRTTVPDGWYGSVIDSEGRLVARTQGDPQWIAEPASPYARAARLRGGGGMYESVSLEGEAVTVAYRVLPSWSWSVHIALPRALYHAPLETSLWLLTGGGLLALLLAGAFLALLAREAEARRRAAAALEESSRMEALGRMTGGVAHDFNNLLMIAQSGAEAIKRRLSDPARVTTYADSILTAVQRGASLTRQLVAFARKSPQEPVSFLLQDRTDELLPLLERSTRAGIATSLSIPNDTWPVFADPNALEVALVNLAVNARDAMPDGGSLTLTAANVTLTARNGHSAGLRGDHVAIRVRDTGTGIHPEDMSRVFEPFFTTKEVGKGTGLGLSQVLGFATQSGGAVTVDSRVGQGTTVTLHLPRATGTPMDTSPPRHPAAPEGIDEGRILLIEDNPDVARATGTLLREAGYAVVWVPNGTAALERIERGEAFDAVLSDIVLDGGPSGLELAPLLRDRHPGLPVVLMTGYSEALAARVPDGLTVLAKPFGQSEMVAALRAARLNAGRPVARQP